MGLCVSMDYRQFDQCKPKHFGPPTALQGRLTRDIAYRLPGAPSRQRLIQRLIARLHRRLPLHQFIRL
jgi:hypothetical protein